MHFHHEIDIAVGPRRAPGAASEQHNAQRMEGLDDPPGDLLNGRLLHDVKL